MGTVTIIVIGVVVISVVGILGDIATNIVKAKNKARESAGSVPAPEIERLENRLTVLEARIEERDDSVRKLQDELRFVSRMLEDRSGRGSAN
jgi:hypothetical protein